MDKCACLNPESILGVLKTVYLFLEGQNFRQTCDTFLNESQVLGYAEFKRAMARILVLKPSVTEVVKISHADPAKSENQIQGNLPIVMDHGVQGTPPKNLNIYYGEPLCIDRPECSLSAPQLASGVCPCKARNECRKGGINIVETKDNTRNDMETERILKKAIRDEVRVAPPLLPDPSESVQSKKDHKRINFRPSTQVQNTADLQAESQATFAEPEEEAPVYRPVSKQSSTKYAEPAKSEPKVVAKSVSKLEKSHDTVDEVLLRTEDLKGAASVASVKSKASTVSDVKSRQSVHHKDEKSTHSLASVKSAHKPDPRMSTTSVRFDVNAVVTTPVLQEPARSISEMISPSDADGLNAASTVSVKPSQQVVRSSSHAFDVDKEASKVSVCPSTGTLCPASKTSLPASIVTSRKSLASRAMSVGSIRPSMKSVAPVAAPSRYEPGALNIGQCVLSGGLPVQSHSMATSTIASKCVESATEGVATVCKSVSCTPSLVERSASTRSLKERSQLDFNKVKKELRSGCPSVRIVLLQALRWRITRATNEANRNDTISDYARHDLLSLHGTPSGSHRSMVEEFLCATSDKTAVQHEEGMARMVNVMASLTLGRDYLCQDESLLTRLIIPLVMDVYPYKAQTTEVTKEHLLVALQKLSLRNNMRLVMIQAGLPEYLVFYLASRHNAMSDYCLEYCLALFMNLCLHTETHTRLKKKSKDIVKFIKDFLSAGHDSCLSYLNSAMYNLFMDPDIRKEGKHEHLDTTLTQKSQTVDDETRQQMEVVLELLNVNKQSTPCVECGCIDQDDEIDHLESELEFGDPVKGNPNGEDLLRLYQSRTLSPGSNAVPLTCTCRPITPSKRISVSEKCPTAMGHATASMITTEPEKKSKKHKFCFCLCGKKKSLDQTSLKDDERVLAREDCPKSETVCCTPDDTCSRLPMVPSKFGQSRVSICSSVLAIDPSDPIVESSSIKRSISRQTVSEEPSKTTTVSEQIEETIITTSPSQQSTRPVEEEIITPSCVSVSSKQPSVCSSRVSRPSSLASRHMSRTLICAEAEDDPCIDVCTGKQPTVSRQTVCSQPSRQTVCSQASRQTVCSQASRQTVCSQPSRQRSIICKEPSVQPEMIVEEPIIVPEQASVLTCPSKQASMVRSASCGSIAASKAASIRSCRSSRMSVCSVKTEQSTQSLKKEPSLMRSLTDDTASTKSQRPSQLNLVTTEDKSVQESGPEEEPKKKRSSSCMKCCVAKPKKQESTMSANLESEIIVEDEVYEPEEVCGYADSFVCEKAVSTDTCGTCTTASKGVFAREPSTYVPPSFTRSVINNPPRQKCQDTYYWCNQQQRQPCAPCVAAGGYCATPNYQSCYREPSQANYGNKSSTFAYSYPQSQQQRSRYACDCYNNVKKFVQSTPNTISCDPTCPQAQQYQNRTRSCQ